MSVVRERKLERSHAAAPATFRLPPPAGRCKARVLALAATTLLTGVALLAGLVLEQSLRLPNILLVFLPVVLFAAVRFGLAAATWASVMSILATSFFLAPPTMSFAVSDPNNIWALLIFLAVAIVTSSLAAQVQQRAAAADRHSRIVESLYEFSSKLGAISDEEALIHEATRQIETLLDLPVVMFVPKNGRLSAVTRNAGDAGLPAAEQLAAEWCWKHGQPAGRGTGNLAGAASLYLPLDAGRGTVGAMGLTRDRPGPLLNPDEERLLDTLVRQVAINLERARLAEEMHHAEMLAATEKLRTPF